MLDWNNSVINGVLSGPESKDLFTSDWKDPEMGAEATIQMDSFTSGVYRATNLFGQVLEQILEQLQPPEEVLLLQICR